MNGLKAKCKYALPSKLFDDFKNNFEEAYA